MCSASMPGPGEQLGAGTGAGHLADGEPGEPEVALPGGEQGVGDRRAEAALRVVVLGDHDPPAGVLLPRPSGPLCRSA